MNSRPVREPRQMSRVTKKILLWVLVPVALFLALLAALQFLAPRIVNQESVKNGIEAAVSKELGGKLTYERVDLSILPRPRVAVRGPNLSIPGSLSGTLKSLDVYPELLPLIAGKLRIAKVWLDHPDVTLSLPGISPSGRETPPGTSPEQTLAAVLGFAASRMPNLMIGIEQGRLIFLQDGQRLFSLREVDSRIAFIPATTEASKEQFRIAGSIKGVITDGESLPGPIGIAVKRFEALPRTISFSDVRARILDTSLAVSGRLDDYLTAVQKADLTLSGTMGSDTVQWIRAAASLPSELTIHAPVTVPRARLLWSRGGPARLEGNASVRGGPALSFDVSRGPDLLVVKELRIRDKESQAALMLSLGNKVIDLAFSGNLSQSTLNHLFEHERFEFGWLRGDLRARIVLDRPSESTAFGTLEGKRLVPPLQLKVPVTIDRISLHAAEHTVTFDSLVLTLGTNRHTVRGEITASADGWLLNLISDGLEWEPLQQLLAPEAAETAGGEPAAPRKPYVPLRGTIRLETEYLTAGGWTARPVRAEISLEPDRVRVSLNEAVVCGVALPGTVTFTPADMQLDFRPAANHQPLESSLNCLAGKDLRITGAFDLSGSLSTRGPEKALVKNLQGTMSFTAKKGRVYHDWVIARVLAYLNVTELLRGSYPDPEKEGIPYDSFVIRGNVKNGTLVLKEMVVVGPLMNIAGRGSINLSDRTLDVTVLAAPFKTADAVVKKIPLLKDILGGSLVTIPIRVRGPFEKPEVTAVPPDAVAEGLVGMMKRTLQLPFKLIEPIIPGGKKQP